MLCSSRPFRKKPPKWWSAAKARAFTTQSLPSAAHSPIGCRNFTTAPGPPFRRWANAKRKALRRSSDRAQWEHLQKCHRHRSEHAKVAKQKKGNGKTDLREGKNRNRSFPPPPPKLKEKTNWNLSKNHKFIRNSRKKFKKFSNDFSKFSNKLLFLKNFL